MSTTEILNKILEKVERLEERIIEMNNMKKNYLENIEHSFIENPNFSLEYEQGICPPHEYATEHEHNLPCIEKGKWPHLFHTFNPQLNNISDMLVYLINCSCSNKIEPEIEENKKQLIDIRDLIEQLYKKQKCLTLEDLEKYIGGEKFKTTIKPLAIEENKEKSNQKVQPPFII